MLLSLVKWTIRRATKNSQWQDIHRVRRGFIRLSKRWNTHSRHCNYLPEVISGVPAEWITPKEAHSDTILLYFHGGGYNAGNIDTHRGLVSQIAIAAKLKAVLIDYRLAPEHPFPAAMNDAVQVYKELLARGISSKKIAFGGDSAGGGLTLATLLFLRDNQIEMPGCAIVLSPWTDLTLSGPSYQTKQNVEPMLVAAAFPSWVKNYSGEADPQNPYISPLFAELNNLPPIHIQVGSEELLLDDSIRFYEKSIAAGSPVQLQIFNKYFHVFQAFYIILPGARKAIRQLADFLNIHLSK
ncbi:MAG: alpha/beta hydrolase [Chitinophagales bacterium]